MTPSPLSVALINSATLGYLLATVVFILYFISKQRWAYVLAPLVFGISLLAHAGGLIDRWYLGGLYRPPWTNLYESLVYFSFGLGLISFVIDLRFKIRTLGAFVAPLVFSGLGLAFLVPVKEITPLVPSLQSWWILAHSCLAAFAYSGFIVASALAFLYLIKIGMDERVLGLSTAFVELCMMLLVGGSDVFLRAKYLMQEMVFVNDRWSPNPMPGTDPVKFFMIEVSPLSYFFWATAALSLVALLLYATKQPSFWNRARQLLALAGLAHLSLLVYFFWTIATYQSVTLGSNPYSLTLLILALLILIFSIAYLYRGPSIAERLPEAAWLDQLSYKVTLFAFPFMTLILITGAIWAHEAWGRFWGWDPKETTALVTWMIYAAYLHSRMTPGWSGKRSATISLIGFFSVIFTYLGTNLVLSGLHSYGSK